MYRLLEFPLTDKDVLKLSCFDNFDSIKFSILNKHFNCIHLLEKKEKPVLEKFLNDLFSLPNVFAGKHPQGFRRTERVDLNKKALNLLYKDTSSMKDNNIFVISNLQIYYIESVIEFDYIYFPKNFTMYDKIYSLVLIEQRKFIIDEFLSATK